MHRLFTLVLILLFNQNSFAVKTEATVRLRQERQPQFRELPVDKSTQTVSAKVSDAMPALTLGADMTFEKQDYSTRILTLESGQSAPLSQVDNGERQIGKVSAEYLSTSYLFGVNFQQDLRPSLFSRKSYGGFVQKSVYSGATKLTGAVEKSDQDQPESFFTDPGTLLSRRRVSKIENFNWTLGVEQIVTDFYKIQVNYAESKFVNYRPTQRGIDWNNAVAVTTRWTFRPNIGFRYEDRAEPLQDDRGYFTAVWLDSQISYEWKLDSSVGFEWSTLYETENDPRRNYDAKLGTDTFGAFVSHRIKEVAGLIRIAQTSTSEKGSGFTAEGELQWTF